MSDGIFGNPPAGDAQGRYAADVAENYGYVLTWVRGAIRAAVGAAGHPLVVAGYEAFGEAARGEVERLRQHGSEAGSKLRASAATVADTDVVNAGRFDATAAALGAAADPDGGR